MLRYENRDRGFVPDYEWEQSNAAAGLDNSLLFVTATTGIVGLAAYVFLLGKAVFVSFRRLRTLKPLNALLTATLIAIIVHSMFNNSLFYPWVMIWLWLLFAVVHAQEFRR